MMKNEPKMVYLQHPSQLFVRDYVMFAYNGRNRAGAVVKVAPKFFTIEVDGDKNHVRTFRFDGVSILLSQLSQNPYGIQIHNA